MPIPKNRISRRRILVTSGIAAATLPAAAAIDGFLITPRRLVTTKHAIGGPAAVGSTAVAGSAALAGFAVRIAQITDLHMSVVGRLHEMLFTQLHDAAPGIVVLTGDMIERPEYLDALDAFLRELPDVPKFATLGNWEYWSGVPLDTYRRLYDSHGIDLLVNRSVECAVGGRSLRITGLDDLMAGSPDADGPLTDAAPCANHLLLAHCPASREACPLPAGHRPSLILSGHTHGGQIAPFGLALVLPPGSGPYVAGWYRDGGPPLYVSRGIGTSMLPIRIGSTPELAIFDWSLA